MVKAMRLNAVDGIAVSKMSWLHLAPVSAKWHLIVGTMGLVLLTAHPLPLCLAITVLVGIAFTGGLPLRWIAIGSVAPLPMVTMFLVSQPTMSMLGWATVTAKVVATVTAGAIAVFTTPAGRLLELPTRLFPPVVASSAVITYRSFFVLFAGVGARRRALKIRGAFPAVHPDGRPWWRVPAMISRRLSIAGIALGMTVLEAIDASVAYDDALRLRGYDPRRRPSLVETGSVWSGRALTAVGGGMVACGLLFRFGSAAWGGR